MHGLLDRALKREKELDSIRRLGVSQDKRNTATEQLRQFAWKLAEEARGLPDSGMLFFGGCGNGGEAMKSQVQKLLSDVLPEDVAPLAQNGQVSEMADRYIREFVQELQEEIGIHLSEGILQELREVFEKGVWKAEAPKILQKLMPGFLERRLPALLRISLKEELMGQLGGGSARNVAEDFYQDLCEKGVKSALLEAITGRIEGAEQLCRSQVNAALSEITHLLPRQGVEALGYFGFGELDQPIWFEVVPQANDAVKLLVHERGVTHTYHDIKPEQLDREFFYRLLTYRVWPQWDGFNFKFFCPFLMRFRYACVFF